MIMFKIAWATTHSSHALCYIIFLSIINVLDIELELERVKETTQTFVSKYHLPLKLCQPMKSKGKFQTKISTESYAGLFS